MNTVLVRMPVLGHGGLDFDNLIAVIQNENDPIKWNRMFVPGTMVERKPIHIETLNAAETIVILDRSTGSEAEKQVLENIKNMGLKGIWTTDVNGMFHLSDPNLPVSGFIPWRNGQSNFYYSDLRMKIERGDFEKSVKFENGIFYGLFIGFFNGRVKLYRTIEDLLK